MIPGCCMLFQCSGCSLLSAVFFSVLKFKNLVGRIFVRLIFYSAQFGFWIHCCEIWQRPCQRDVQNFTGSHVNAVHTECIKRILAMVRQS